MPVETSSKKDKLRVILDSNALFVPLQFKIDVFEELKTLLNRNLELVLLQPIKEELEKMAKKGAPKMRKEANYALKLAEKCTLIKLEGMFAGSPDDAIVKVAGEWKCPVFTNDKALRRRLRDISVPVIYVRQKSRLEIDGRV
ncbi:MAG: DNA-binding protein [Candidatus Bathyarchaeota archaeon]|jgi:rRNA-processing protein FCF1|nr:DNA-binding protein [Candidatus Bathyarchaeota archaeon A05DMB-3]MDH7606275.1 DNA-binding protein [Candidatus Bathyarchaeota archaeon]